MLPHRGAFSAAYAAQVLVEAAHFSQKNWAGVTLDLIKCFNQIDHLAGYKLLKALGFPEFCLQMWFRSMKKHQRFWMIAGQTLGPVWSSCGYPEGDSHSVLVILAIAYAWAQKIKATCTPALRLASYADNWTWSSSNMDDHSPAARGTLVVTALCGLSVDWDKTWLWSVDTATAKQLETILFDVTHQPIKRQHHARDLGLEMQYSGSHAHGHRADRWDQGLQKLMRLQHAHLTLSVKEHLVLSSVFPAMFHGCELFPCSKDMLTKTRSKVADALYGKCASMSPCIALLLAKPQILDPAFFVLQSSLRNAMSWLGTQDAETQSLFF